MLRTFADLDSIRKDISRLNNKLECLTSETKIRINRRINVSAETVRVNLPQAKLNTTIYEEATPKWLFVNSIKEQNTIEQCEKMFSCREYTTRHILELLHGQNTSLDNKQAITLAEELSFIVFWRKDNIESTEETFKKNFEVVNAIEKELGWPITEFKPAEMVGVHVNHVSYYFEVHNRWKYSPHTMSIFLMLIRSGHILGKDPIHNLKCNDCLNDFLLGKTDMLDYIYYAKYAKYFIAFLRNIDYIYYNRDWKYNFSYEAVSPKYKNNISYFGWDGASKLFGLSSIFTDVVTKWKEVRKEILGE